VDIRVLISIQQMKAPLDRCVDWEDVAAASVVGFIVPKALTEAVSSRQRLVSSGLGAGLRLSRD
jgi:hypothetical protein